MSRPRCVGRLLSLLVGLGLGLAPIEAGAADGAPGAGAGDSQTTEKAPRTAHEKSHRATHKKVAGQRKKAKTAKTAKTAKSVKSAGTARPTRGKTSRAARLKPPSRDPGQVINDDVQITPFPSHASAARKALSQNRRDQLDDAEKAARDPGQTDRWQTVLFDLRGFDSRADAEACFWRVIAYYRLGEIARARSIRQNCEIAGKDQPVIDQEDIQSASLQPATALPELAAGDEPAPAPVANPAGFAGAGPTRLER
jgi:hypothetical protein